MFNRAFYIASFILFLFTFISCQESTTGPETMNDDINNQRLTREGQVDVEGIVYKDSNPVVGATVKLYKGGNYLDQDITDSNGFYQINVCGQGQGAGTYTVRAVKYYREEEWCDTENFYWDGGSEPLAIEVDLYLIRCETK